MNTKQINNLVRRAYSALDVLNNIKMTAYRDHCFKMACEEERGHRRFKPDGLRIPASVQDAGRFFVVLRIAESLLGRRYEIADILNCQQSALFAAALVATYEKEIREALKDLELRELVGLDYCELVGSK
jgi:hypothetical protein